MAAAPGPPPSWAELTSRLQALLPRFNSASTAAGDGLLQLASQAWYDAAHAAAAAAAAAGAAPEGAEHERLRR